MWIGTESRGLNFFKDGKFISYRQSESGLPGDDISCLYADKDGVLWIGTAGHGLARLQNGKWTRFATTNGLASDSISYILEDGAGYLWLGSNMGLMRISKKSLDDLAGGAGNVIACRTYGKADGLPSRECSAGSQPAAIRTRDGRLWFPTTKGLTSVDPAELKPNLQPPLVMIESVRVDGIEQKTNLLSPAWPQSIVIPPGREQLEIDYTALNFSAPELVRFKYWLEGHEKGWTDASGERVARYPKLPPGQYRFHVIACNEDGIWNRAGRTLEITVLPQFWQTAWFRVAAIVFILGMVAAIVRYLSTQKLHRQLQSLKQREALEQRARPHRPRPARPARRQPDPSRPARRNGGGGQGVAGGNRVARATDFPDRARDDARARRNRLGHQSRQRHARRPGQLRLQTRAGISRAGRLALPRGCAGAIARRFRFRRKSATTSSSRSRRPSTTSSNTRRRPRPGFDCAWSRDKFILEIEDNGCGMAKQDRAAKPKRPAQHEKTDGRHRRRIFHCSRRERRDDGAADGAD